MKGFKYQSISKLTKKKFYFSRKRDIYKINLSKKYFPVSPFGLLISGTYFKTIQLVNFKCNAKSIFSYHFPPQELLQKIFTDDVVSTVHSMHHFRFLISWISSSYFRLCPSTLFSSSSFWSSSSSILFKYFSSFNRNVSFTLSSCLSSNSLIIFRTFGGSHSTGFDFGSIRLPPTGLNFSPKFAYSNVPKLWMYSFTSCWMIANIKKVIKISWASVSIHLHDTGTCLEMFVWTFLGESKTKFAWYTGDLVIAEKEDSNWIPLDVHDFCGLIRFSQYFGPNYGMSFCACNSKPLWIFTRILVTLIAPFHFINFIFTIGDQFCCNVLLSSGRIYRRNRYNGWTRSYEFITEGNQLSNSDK